MSVVQTVRNLADKRDHMAHQRKLSRKEVAENEEVLANATVLKHPFFLENLEISRASVDYWTAQINKIDLMLEAQGTRASSYEEETREFVHGYVVGKSSCGQGVTAHASQCGVDNSPVA